MENNIVIFSNEDFGQVRTIKVDDEPWFVGKDVAEILGYSNTSKAVSTHVDDEDKCFFMIDIAPSQNGNVLTGQSRTAFINESGLYSLILRSKLSTAKQFKRWVTSEVLPSIRKTGKYDIQEKQDSYLIDDKVERAKRWIEEQEYALLLAKQIEEQKPLVDFAESVEGSDDCITVGQLAKQLVQRGVKTGQNKLFSWLRKNEYLCSKGRNKNIPTQRAMDMGLFQIRESSFTDSQGNTHLNTTTLVTGKGQTYFHKKFCA